MLRINAGRNPNPNSNPDPNPNANANANANAQQDQTAAGQQDVDMHDAEVPAHPAADNPGNAQIPPGAPGGGLNFNAPPNLMFMQQHFGGFGGPNLNAPQNPVQQHFGGPLGEPNLNAPRDLVPQDFAGPGGGMHLNAAQNPMFMRGPFELPGRGMMLNVPLNPALGQQHPGEPAGLPNLQAPMNHAFAPPDPNANAQQDLTAARQQDQGMHDAEAPAHPAANNPGNAQIPPGAPGGGLNFNAPPNPMFMPQHFGGPFWGPILNARQNPVQQHFGGPLGEPNLNAPRNLAPQDLAWPGGGMPLNAAQNPVFMQRPFELPGRGQLLNAPLNPLFLLRPPEEPGGLMNLNAEQNPMFMRGPFERPGGGMMLNVPLNPAFGQQHPGGPAGRLNLPALAPRAHIASTPYLGAANMTPAQKELQEILSNPQSAPFREFYLMPSQRFADDPATGRTALMLAAQADDPMAVGALMSRTILTRRASDGVIEHYHYYICDDERERRGQHVEGPIRRADYLHIPTPAGMPLSLMEIPGILSKMVNARAMDGRSPLMFAAESGSVVAAEKLLYKGADVHAHAHDGSTALAFAVANGHVDMVVLLIESEALISPVTPIEDVIEKTGFSSAALNGHIGLVQAFLNELPVLTACRNTRLAQQLTKDIYPVAAVNEMLREALDNEENLIAAAQDKSLDSLEKLIAGKSPAWLNSALRTVCGHGLAVAVEPLIRHGAEVDAKSKGGQTALLAAVEYGHLGVVKELIERGAAVNNLAHDGVSVLGKAVRRAEPETIRYLLASLTNWFELPRRPRYSEFLAKHNAVEAALNAAAERGHLEAVRMLFDGTAGQTFSPPQIANARQLAQAAGHADVVRLLTGMESLARLLRTVAGVDMENLPGLDALIVSHADMNATLGKERLSPLLAMLGNAFDRSPVNVMQPKAKIDFQELVGKKLLRAGADATVRNENGESVLQLAAMARAFDLANQIVQSGQAEEVAGEYVRSALLNNDQASPYGYSPGVEFTSKSSLLDWLVFSEPVSQQGKHYLKLQRHGVWPQDPGNAEQRLAAMRVAAEKGCAGVILALEAGADRPLIQDLMLRAARSGSWNVIKTLVNAGWEDALDNDVMGAALKSAVDHRNHAAVDDTFRLNALLAEKGRRAAGRTLTRENVEAVFQSLLTEGTVLGSGVPLTDFKMVERLIKSTPRALLPEGAGPNGLAPLLTKRLLHYRQAWATFDHIWCAQGVSQEDKDLLQPHGRWPRDEQDGGQIIFAMESAARSGCPHIFQQLQQLPALGQWRQSQENDIAFNAMMQRAMLAAAEGPNHNMFAL